ncbi:hypothetical protein AMTRI_Chr08g165390 [Amborella trichopoda]
MGKGAKEIVEVMAKVKLEPTKNGFSSVKMEEDVELKVKKGSMEEDMEEAKVDLEIESEVLGLNDSSSKGGEDRLVRTIDLFMVPSPIDPHTQLSKGNGTYEVGIIKWRGKREIPASFTNRDGRRW